MGKRWAATQKGHEKLQLPPGLSSVQEEGEHSVLHTLVSLLSVCTKCLFKSPRSSAASVAAAKSGSPNSLRSPRGRVAPLSVLDKETKAQAS